MGLDLRGVDAGGRESGFVDEEGLVLDGCIGYETVARDLELQDFELFQWCEFRGHCFVDFSISLSSHTVVLMRSASWANVTSCYELQCQM